MTRSYTIDEVFGINRDIPLNYVTRSEVDDKFIDSLSRSQHIVIYGSSKQGKTSLRKKCLSDTDYIVVSCQNKWNLAELHASVLKEAGISVKQSTEKTVSGIHKVSVEVSAKGGIPLVSQATGKGNYEYQNNSGEKDTIKHFDLDPNDPNDIIRALSEAKFNQYVVLEDFHYLPDETQRDFSFSLKTIHENSRISFIIVGVWREENRLIAFNGDLTDRVLSVDVDTWSNTNLNSVIDQGCLLLNIYFDIKFREDLISRSFESVHIVQEACRRACRADRVFETVIGNAPTIGANTNVIKLVSAVVSEHAARYHGFLDALAGGFQETELEMPKWLVYAILCNSIDQLENGIRLRRISAIIKSRHPKGTTLNNGNITQILNSVTSLQLKKGIRPLVVTYDNSNTILNIVDKGFLIWLSTQNINELMEDIGLPAPLSQDEMNSL